MALNIKFDQQSVLPELARQLVETLQENRSAVFLGIEADKNNVDLVFGLDGTDSLAERFVYTDANVLVAAKTHCEVNSPDFMPTLQAYIERANAIANSPLGPIRRPGSLAEQAPAPVGAD